jgi:hypothetical protein
MSCPPDDPGQAGLDNEAARNGNGPDLASLRARFPCFRIWREHTFDRARYMARSLHPGLNPHTVLTDDFDELRAALEPSRHAACPRPHPAGRERLSPLLHADTPEALAGQIRAPEAIRARQAAAGQS